MKYYSLDDGNALGVWSDDRNMEFVARPGYEESLGNIVSSFDSLRTLDVPIYRLDRLVYMFGTVDEVSKEEYELVLEKITDLRAKSVEMQQEVDSKSPGEIRRYINNFPSNLPGLVNRAQLSKLIWMFNEANGLNDDGAEVDNTDEQIDDAAAAIYCILRHVENTGDPSVVETLLKVVDR